jgi:hypothetical protein
MATFPGLPRPVFSYNFGAVQCIIGTVPLANFGTDGSISFEFPSQLVESEVSADGYVVYTANNDERVRVTITLSEVSGAVPLLDELVKAQAGLMFAGGPLTPVPFYLLDPATGDTIASEYTVFLQEPTITKQKAIGTREYLVELPYARFRQQPGVTNIPVV